MKTFKVDAQGDELYFKAPNLDEAKEQFEALCGPVPPALLTWTEEELPEGQEHAADVR